MELLKIVINSQPNKQIELFRTCHSIAEQTFLVSGCIESRVVKEGDNENVILIEQQWKRWADLTTYFESEDFKVLLGAMKLFGRNYTIQVNGKSTDSVEVSSKNNI